MHWSNEIAKQIIERHPKLREYVVASGISPSGSVHIGNFRETITNYYIARALENMGKKVRMIFSWDEFDRLRKVPAVVAGRVTGFEQHVGKALADIPSPFEDGTKNYAEHFEREYEASLAELHINEIPVQFIYQARQYKSGAYAEAIVHCVRERRKIYDIIMSFKTQEADEGERENYYPIQIYCPNCGRDSTRVVGASADGERIDYVCKCSDKTYSAKIREAQNIKLVWKVDWAMRWRHEGVVFEAAGPDHQTEGGSYQVSSRIAREIFGYEPPVTASYGWIGVKGLQSDKMSSSSGASITPTTCLQIYEPEIIRYLFAKYANDAPFEFGFDDSIVRHYTEFDRGVKSYLAGETVEEYARTIFELCLFKCTDAGEKTAFSTLATIAPMGGFDNKIIGSMLGKAGIDFSSASSIRIKKVRFWLENYQSDKIYKLRDEFNNSFFAGLDETEQAALGALHDYLTEERTEKEIQEYLYQIINDPNKSKKENITAQQRYFKIFYNMLFSRDDGPRLYLYLAAADKKQYLKLLKRA